MMRPYLVSGVRAYGKEIQHFNPTMLMQMGDSNVIRQLRACTEEVVLSGTGRSIQSPHYGIGGKTGTAQVADNIDGHWYPYSAGIYQGSFVGYFPTKKPKYTICVVLRTRPHAGSYYGGTLAAPVFRMISDKIFASGMGTWSGPLDSIAQVSPKNIVGGQTTWSSYQELIGALGLPMNKQPIRNGAMTQVYSDTSKKPAIREQQVFRGIVPNVNGMGLRDALYLLEASGLQVQVIGSGFVRSQSIAPGTKAEKGQQITLQLSQA